MHRLAWKFIFPINRSIAAVSVYAVGIIKPSMPGNNWIVSDGVSANQKQRKISAKEQTVIIMLKNVFAEGLQLLYLSRILQSQISVISLTIHQKASKVSSGQYRVVMDIMVWPGRRFLFCIL
jgi:hypothetical protein